MINCRNALAALLLLSVNAQAINLVVTDPMAPIDSVGQCYLKQATNGTVADIAGRAHLLALISDLAYFNHEDVETALLENLGFTQVKFFAASENEMKLLPNDRWRVVASGAQGIWAENDQLIVIAFRGTADLEDVITDSLTHQVPMGRLGKVHEGFYGALKAVWSQIASQLQQSKAKPVYFTGHSLGAAMAAIAASHQLEEQSRAQSQGIQGPGQWTRPFVKGIVTFGSPRVGDSQFQASFDKLVADSGQLDAGAGVDTQAYSTGYADSHDPVTRVPSHLMHVDSINVFEDVGFTNVLNTASWAKDLRFLDYIRIRNELKAHSTSNYLEYTYRQADQQSSSGCLTK